MDFPLSLRRALITSVAFIATAASAESGANGTWLYPDPNTTPTFNYLDTLNASWTSDFLSPWLHLYNKTAPATGSLEFPLNYALEPFDCHFELSRRPAVGLGPPFAMSGTFNVAIESSAQPVTWSQNTVDSSTASIGANASKHPESTAPPTYSSTASPTPSSITSPTFSSASPTFSPTASPIPSSTASPTPPPTASPTLSSTPAAGTQASGNSGLGQGAKIDIGVGVALGILALIAAAAVFFFLRRRKHARTTPTPKKSYRSELHTQNYGYGKFEKLELPAAGQMHEKDGTEKMVHEKDSAPVATQTIGELEAPRY